MGICRPNLCHLFAGCFLFWCCITILVTRSNPHGVDECMHMSWTRWINWPTGITYSVFGINFCFLVACQFFPTCMAPYKNTHHELVGHDQEMTEVDHQTERGSGNSSVPGQLPRDNDITFEIGTEKIESGAGLNLQIPENRPVQIPSSAGNIIQERRTENRYMVGTSTLASGRQSLLHAEEDYIYERRDWNSLWLTLYGTIFLLGYDASVRATYAFGREDANRNENTVRTCMNPKRAFGLSEDVFYKLSPRMIVSWMLFFIITFVTVRRKRDAWFLSSFFNFRTQALHSFKEKLGLILLFIQCVRFSLDVLFNGISTVKQFLCTSITISLAMMVFFFTLHVLQADIHKSNKKKQNFQRDLDGHQRKTLPHNYVWLLFCLGLYWVCGFFMYFSSGSGGEDENFMSGFYTDTGLVIAAYLILHCGFWFLFLGITWFRKDKIFEKVAEGQTY